MRNEIEYGTEYGTKKENMQMMLWYHQCYIWEMNGHTIDYSRHGLRPKNDNLWLQRNFGLKHII